MTQKKFKITIAKNAGFCFGVKRAYDLTCVNSKNCTDVFIIGKLVHNNDVCADLRKRGIKEIKSLDNIREGTVIFTAHGVGPKLYKEASQKGLKIIDTTCPKVIKAQRIAKNYTEKKYQVIIFGDKNHKEVQSIREWSQNKAIIAGNFSEIKKIIQGDKNNNNSSLRIKKLGPIENKKYCLISQTTQNVQEYKKIISHLKRILQNFIYFNTICPSTDDRQKEIRQLAKNNDLIIVIGGKDSANSRRLYEITKKTNKNSFFIENEKDLKKIDLAKAKKIAVAAGASTPEWIIKKSVDNLKKRLNNSALVYP